MTRLVLPALLALAAGCGGGTPGDGEGDDARPGDDTPDGAGPGSGSGGPHADADPSAPDGSIPDVACTGTVTGGLNGTLTDCPSTNLYGYDMGARWTTGMIATQLNGAQLETGPCSFSYELLGPPTTGTTYTFDSIRGGVSNLYKTHPTGPMTIWACGTNGTVTYGSGFALTFTSLVMTGESMGTQVWKAHGHVGCHYAAQDGSPPIDLTLTF